MNGQTDWLSAIGILLAGLVLGFMFVYAYVMKRRGQQPFVEDVELRDLEAKRDALLQQLRDLDANEKDERARLEVEAAQALRAIDQHAGVAAADSVAVDRRVGGLHTESAAPAPTGFFARHPELKGFAWGVGSLGAIAFLWYFGFQYAKPKDEAGGPMPMQQAPLQQQAQSPQAAQEDALVRDLENRIQKSPDDLDARLELTHMYLDKENMMGVFAQTEYILKKRPNDAQAATYQALVRMAMGQADQALQLLKSATKNDPKLLDAWVTLAWYYTQTGNKAEAHKAIEQAKKQHPEQTARLDQVLTQMEAQVANDSAPASSQPVNEAAALPPGHPPVDGAQPAQQPMASSAPSSGGAIVVTVNLASGKTAPAGGVLYILARGEGVTAGPPVAVKRIAATTFPITVDLSAADSMMGQPIPPKVRLEARLDADGDVMSRGPDDLDAVQDGVAVGSQVALTLK